jgi:microbial collagenase
VRAACVRCRLLAIALVAVGLGAPQGGAAELTREGPLGRKPAHPPRAPDGARPALSSGVVPFHDLGFPVRPGFPERAPVEARPRRAAVTSYTYADLVVMDHPTLLATLRKIRWEEITDLFLYSEAARQFYDDDPRMDALLNGLRQSAETYTSSDARGIQTLVEVVRAGFYLAFYYPPLARLDTWEYHQRCLPALDTLTANPHFGWTTPTQVEVMESTGLLMGSGVTSVGLVTLAGHRLRQLNDNFPGWLTDATELGARRRNAVYYLSDGINYAVYYAIDRHYNQPRRSPFYGHIGGFYEEVGRLALIGQTDPSNEWLITNAAWWLRDLGGLVPGRRPNRLLTEVIGLYGQWRPPSIQAVQGIVELFGGVDADGRPYDLDQVRQELHGQVLPLRYTFDGGAAVFETGPRVDPVKVQRLYWAVKEVKAQFHRAIGRDVPLEPGGADDRLLAVVYDSPYDYDFNYFLNGLGTNNGGIYIEAWGTFFTYERTPAESIYTLEDLFRHEYAHYLQGRFLVPGLWGGPLYANERLTWFEEGQAEFLAGSSRDRSVRLRRALVQDIAYDGSPAWMTLPDVLHATYGSGFRFYRYAMAVFAYMHERRPEAMASLVDLVRAGDGAGFDTLVAALSADGLLAADYHQYLQTITAALSGYLDPATSNDYLYEPLPERAPALVAGDIVQASGITNPTSMVVDSDGHQVLVVKGTYTGSTSAGEGADWRAMDAAANAFLGALASQGWAGYRTTNAHFTDYRLAADRYQYDLAFTGKLGVSPSSCTYSLTAAGAKAGAGGGLGSVGVGTASGCRWTALSEVPWIAVTAGWSGSESGTVEYRVLPNAAPARTGTLTAAGRTFTLRQAAPPAGITESEPNDILAAANGPVVSGTLVSGATPTAESDYFYFDLAHPGPVSVILAPDSVGTTWVIVHASNLNHTVAAGTPQGTQMVGSFTATLTGRYYLIVYRWGGTATTYTFVATYPQAPPACSYSISPASASLSPAGGSGVVSVTAGSGCGWSAASGASWISITSGASGFGSGSMSFSVPPNLVVPRAGTLTVAGHTVTLTQGIGGGITAETEPNDSTATADGPVASGLLVSGALSGSESDYYFFDLAVPGPVSVNLSASLAGATWAVYHAGDPSQALATGAPRGGEMVGGFSATATGRYFLRVYRDQGPATTYRVLAVFP